MEREEKEAAAAEDEAAEVIAVSEEKVPHPASSTLASTLVEGGGYHGTFERV